MNTEAKIINKILADWSQQYFKRVYQGGFVTGKQDWLNI